VCGLHKDMSVGVTTFAMVDVYCIVHETNPSLTLIARCAIDSFQASQDWQDVGQGLEGYDGAPRRKD
jgi:hypothetical protein